LGILTGSPVGLEIMADTVTQTAIIQMLPSLLASVAGIVVAVWLWRRHPTVSAITALALGVRVISALGGLAFQRWVFTSIDQGADPTTVGFYSGLFNFYNSLLGTAALILLIVAVFWGRAGVPAEKSAG
jgi:hypothetical protein